MKIIKYYFFIIVNIVITLEQKASNNTEKNDSDNKNKVNNNNNKSKKIKTFLLHIALIIVFIILLYIIIKIFVKCCKKKFAMQKLFEGFSDNKLLKVETIDHVNYVYGFNYVIDFLLNKIFISCKFKQKKNELKNCGNCSICLNGFDLSDKIFITACNHVFHNNCMKEYLALIIKDINPDEEIENFHDYFHCPNCKEYLFTNRSFLEQNRKNDNIEEIECKNDSKNHEQKLKDFKNGDFIIISQKPRKNNINKINNFISTEGSSIRNLSELAKNGKKNKVIKKKKKQMFKKGKNNENVNSNNGNENKNKIIDSKNSQVVDIENNNDIQSNMNLKDNIELQKKTNNDNKKPLKQIIINNIESTKIINKSNINENKNKVNDNN